MQKKTISSTADPRTPRLLTSNMYVHDCKCAYMHYIQNIGKMPHRLCIMPFLEVTILFSPETPEKIRDGILTLFI